MTGSSPVALSTTTDVLCMLCFQYFINNCDQILENLPCWHKLKFWENAFEGFGYFHITPIFNWFLLLVSWLFYYATQIAQLLLSSLISLLCLTSFIFNHQKAPSDVKPSYILIFRLIQSAVYLVDVSKDFSCFMQIIDYNSKDLVWIHTKIVMDNLARMP